MKPKVFSSQAKANASLKTDVTAMVRALEKKKFSAVFLARENDRPNAAVCALTVWNTKASKKRELGHGTGNAPLLENGCLER